MTQRDICDFIWLRYSPMRVNYIEDIVKWYDSNKLLGVATDGGAIAGAGMIRITKNKEDGATDYKHDADGDIFWIDLAIADTKEALATMIYMLWDTHGKKPYIAYERKLRGKNAVIFPSRLLDKMLSKCVTAGLATHRS